MEHDDLRWTWYDSLSGAPGEDELLQPRSTATYVLPDQIDPDRIKAVLTARAIANPKPEHWARKLGRRIANVRSR